MNKQPELKRHQGFHCRTRQGEGQDTAGRDRTGHYTCKAQGKDTGKDMDRDKDKDRMMIRTMPRTR